MALRLLARLPRRLAPPIPALLSLSAAIFGSGQVLDTAGAPHPWQGPDSAHPVGEGRDEAEIFLHMLLADPAGRDNAAGRKRERRAEDRFQHYMDSLCQQRVGHGVGGALGLVGGAT